MPYGRALTINALSDGIFNANKQWFTSIFSIFDFFAEWNELDQRRNQTGMRTTLLLLYVPLIEEYQLR